MGTQGPSHLWLLTLSDKDEADDLTAQQQSGVNPGVETKGHVHC